MKFLFFQISFISSGLSILDNTTSSNTINTTLPLDLNNNVVHTPNNVLPNYSGDENFLKEKQPIKRSAYSLINLPVDDCLSTWFLRYLSKKIYNKVIATNNVRSLIRKSKYTKKFYFDLYFNNVQNFIYNEELRNSGDQISFFFESLARKTYHLMYFVAFLCYKASEDEYSELEEKLFNSLDVKFADERNLEVIQFFDEGKRKILLDTLACQDANTVKECKITEPLSKYKSIIYMENGTKESNSTDDNIANKLNFMTNATKSPTESATKEISKLCKPREKEENTGEHDYWILYLVLGATLVIFIFCACLHYCNRKNAKNGDYLPGN